MINYNDEKLPNLLYHALLGTLLFCTDRVDGFALLRVCTVQVYVQIRLLLFYTSKHLLSDSDSSLIRQRQALAAPDLRFWDRPLLGVGFLVFTIMMMKVAFASSCSADMSVS